MLKYSLIILILFFSVIGFSQEDAYVAGDNSGKTSASRPSIDGGFDWSKTTVGGGFGLQFGNYTVIYIAPTFGYYLTEELVVGFGLNYSFEDNKVFTPTYKAQTYGGNVFGQYLIPHMPILTHVELESVNISINYTNDFIKDESINLINFYVGGGLKQQIGGNSYLYVFALWNLSETSGSNYIQTNPVIRIGVAIGL